MADVFQKVDNWLRDEKILPASLEIDSFMLIYRGMKLNANVSLKQAGIVEDSKLLVILNLAEKLKKSTDDQTQFIENDFENSVINNTFPKPPKEGYTTEPSWSELKKLSKQELTSVKNFKI